MGKRQREEGKIREKERQKEEQKEIRRTKRRKKKNKERKGKVIKKRQTRSKTKSHYTIICLAKGFLMTGPHPAEWPGPKLVQPYA